jgi:hypothetical protein
LSHVYRYHWTLRATNGRSMSVRIVTLEGLGTEVYCANTGDSFDVVGPFGIDLCVRDGYATLDFVTNDVPLQRLPVPVTRLLWRIGDGCMPVSGLSPPAAP